MMRQSSFHGSVVINSQKTADVHAVPFCRGKEKRAGKTQQPREQKQI